MATTFLILSVIGADFPAYVQDMKALGVVRYENHLSDGHATYYGADGAVLQGPPRYATIPVSDIAAADELKQAIATHQQGGTDFLTVSRQAAEAGVEKWEVHILKLTCTYFDKAGNVMMVEEMMLMVLTVVVSQMVDLLHHLLLLLLL